MGRKKLERSSIESLFSKVSTMLVPEHTAYFVHSTSILAHFEIWDARESNTRWVIELREKEGFIPQDLSGCDDIVLDGFCNPLEAISHSFVCKPVYLRLFRRRYTCALHEVRGKRGGSDIHFSNEYDVTLKGVKMVPEMGFFLPRTSYTVQVKEAD